MRLKLTNLIYFHLFFFLPWTKLISNRNRHRTLHQSMMLSLQSHNQSWLIDRNFPFLDYIVHVLDHAICELFFSESFQGWVHGQIGRNLQGSPTRRHWKFSRSTAKRIEILDHREALRIEPRRYMASGSVVLFPVTRSVLEDCMTRAI